MDYFNKFQMMAINSNSTCCAGVDLFIV